MSRKRALALAEVLTESHEVSLSADKSLALAEVVDQVITDVENGEDNATSSPCPEEYKGMVMQTAEEWGLALNDETIPPLAELAKALVTVGDVLLDEEVET